LRVKAIRAIKTRVCACIKHTRNNNCAYSCTRKAGGTIKLARLIPLTRGDEYQVHEYACHEGNYAMRHILSAARALEAQKMRRENCCRAEARSRKRTRALTFVPP